MTTKSIFILEVTMHSMVVQRAFFDNESEAIREHDLIKSLMGKDPYDRFEKNKKENFIHTINTPSGPLTVDMLRAEAVRIIDRTKWSELVKDIEDEHLIKKAAIHRSNLEVEHEMAKKFKANQEKA